MARTFRRKHYRPAYVTQDTYEFIDPRTGVRCWAGDIELEGEERAKKIRKWHEEKSNWWGARPRKWFRQDLEAEHRMDCKRELVRWIRTPDHEPLIYRKKLLGHWD